MEIFIVVPKTWVPSCGAAYVAGSLQAAGHKVSGYIFKGGRALREQLQRYRYDVLMTGGLSCSWGAIETILKEARKASLPTVLGGGIVSAEPEIVTRALRPDYSILGQGEVAAVELMDVFKGVRLPETVKGLAFIRGNDYIQNSPRPDIADLDKLPFPNYDIFGFREYLGSTKSNDFDYLSLWDYPRQYLLVASRSCPYHCTFCWHTSGNKYLRRSVESVMKEIRFVVPKYHINTLFLVDELFGCSRSWLDKFCAEMTEFRRTYNVYWQACLRAPMADPGLLKQMKDAGCYLVNYGFESYSGRVLNSMAKRIEPSDILKAYNLTFEARLCQTGMFIFGDPAENEDTIKETLDFWRSHKNIYCSPIWVVPDSPLYRLAIQSGKIKDRLKHQKFPFKLVNLTKMENSKWRRFQMALLKLNILEVNWAPIRDNSGRVEALCPHCKNIVIYKNYRFRWWGRDRLLCRACFHRFDASSVFYYKLMRGIAKIIPEWGWLWFLRSFYQKYVKLLVYSKL